MKDTRLPNIAVVVPTIRYQTEYQEFLKCWNELFVKHRVLLLTIEDGSLPVIHTHDYSTGEEERIFIAENIMGDDKDLIHNFSPACRNLGFAKIARYHKDIDYIITFDDDVRPLGDTIQEHLNVLTQYMPINWLSSTMARMNELKPIYMRGFPYTERSGSEVVLSHGIWLGVPDLDAPTQLLYGERHDPLYYRGPIPRGIEFPTCGMNIAFKRKMLPHIYYAPVNNYKGSERFDDIWAFRFTKQYLDEQELAMVSGYAAVIHARASNVYKNLEREATGIGLNENFWEHQENEFFTMYAEKRIRWQQFMEK